MSHQKIIREIIKKIRQGQSLAQAKREAAKKYKISLLTNTAILAQAKKFGKDKNILNLLRVRKVRTLSGVAVISVLTKPYPCPGRCLYCPTEKGVPKSYLSNEPAVMRAIRNKYDPFRQVQSRLQVLEANGHATDKCELIVIGGTWSALSRQYQSWFIKRCFDGFNNLGSRCLGARFLAEAQKINEMAKHRVVGLTLETRPDFINKEEVERMLNYGCTRVELGVQTIFNDVLNKNQRGHLVSETVRATKLLRDAGLKITYHLMPNLYGSNLKRDYLMFKKIFSSPDFQPDQIKIYPCVVTKNAKLYQLYKTGKYKPYSQKQLINLLTRIKKIVPPYVRIARLIRDIPSSSIVAGNKMTNLRQQLKVKCQCIRCREPRLNRQGTKKAKFTKREYKAAQGREIFLSFEDANYLYAFCRLRLGEAHLRRAPQLRGRAIIRELHTYGELAPLHKKGFVQHSGFGKKLLQKAEEIAQKAGYQKLYVISGVGVRQYYRKLGYRLENNYMVKSIL